MTVQEFYDAHLAEASAHGGKIPLVHNISHMTPIPILFLMLGSDGFLLVGRIHRAGIAADQVLHPVLLKRMGDNELDFDLKERGISEVRQEIVSSFSANSPAAKLGRLLEGTNHISEDGLTQDEKRSLAYTEEKFAHIRTVLEAVPKEVLLPLYEALGTFYDWLKANSGPIDPPSYEGQKPKEYGPHAAPFLGDPLALLSIFEKMLGHFQYHHPRRLPETSWQIGDFINHHLRDSRLHAAVYSVFGGNSNYDPPMTKAKMLEAARAFTGGLSVRDLETFDRALKDLRGLRNQMKAKLGE